jgi:predicted nucleotidyltransferase
VGAIVCGSYITGNPSKHSDIDIHVILDSKTSWRERGNEIIDGILIEYFANPAKRHYQYAEEDYKQRRKINAHMFSTGKVLFDKTGELKKLISDSRKSLLKKYSKPGKIQAELAKYHIWDMWDNLEEVYEGEGDEFFFVFYNYLSDLFDTYSKFLQFDSISAHKIKRFLIDEKDKKKYCVRDFPDKEFKKLFLTALKIKEKSKMMIEYKNLTNHVLEKMGGFNINGWKIRSPA